MAVSHLYGVIVSDTVLSILSTDNDTVSPRLISIDTFTPVLLLRNCSVPTGK